MQTIDCACVIHGHKYDWTYVERLHHMLRRHFTPEVRLHVWTEPDRSLPSHMVHHPLQDWSQANQHRRGWWYKMQMFAPLDRPCRLFYFDLDTVIVGELDWMLALDPCYFWTVRDFRYLWDPARRTINSSIMIWDTQAFDWIWKEFDQHGVDTVVKRYPGDQDYLTRALPPDRVAYLPEERVRSWRWQVQDGGYDHRRRCHRTPGTGADITDQDRVIVFHGEPKPHRCPDPLIQGHWLRVDQ